MQRVCFLTAMVAMVALTCALAGQAAASGQQRTLYGVSIGENAAYALSSLGLHAPRWKAAPAGAPQPQAEYRFVLADYGKAILQLTFDTRIKGIMVSQHGNKEPEITDPYGIRINDSLARLVAKRGQPDKMSEGHEYVYGPGSQLHWVYGTRGGRVTSISVNGGGT